MIEETVVGYWISEKKRQSFNCVEFENVCANEGFVLKQVNLNISLESQGPFHVFLHKLTDTLEYAECGDQHANTIITRLQRYIHDHPEMKVIDPLDNVRTLSDRHKYYEKLREGIKLNDVFTPDYIELRSKSIAENLNCLKKAGIKFPFICKPSLSHGSRNAHKLMAIFNENGLKDCQPPCVAQNFINHNAILYKLFVVGNNFHVVERPSLKNLYSKECELLETLFFTSQEISKSDSNSQWSVISNEDKTLSVKPNHEIFIKIVEKTSKIFGLVLMGVDVVIENETGEYAIIDVNVFPGYDGYPNFFTHLIETIKSLITEHSTLHFKTYSMLTKHVIEDVDSGFESDEKKKLQSMV